MVLLRVLLLQKGKSKLDKTNKVSPSLEDYLEAIYFIFSEKGAARVTDVAVYLGISKPSVNKAINLLKNMGYVNHEHYGLLNLTEKGMDMAKSVANRHKVLTRFLNELLGIDEKDAISEACKIEHHLSADTVDRLRIYLDKVLK